MKNSRKFPLAGTTRASSLSLTKHGVLGVEILVNLAQVQHWAEKHIELHLSPQELNSKLLAQLSAQRVPLTKSTKFGVGVERTGAQVAAENLRLLFFPQSFCLLALPMSRLIPPPMLMPKQQPYEAPSMQMATPHA